MANEPEAAFPRYQFDMGTGTAGDFGNPHKVYQINILGLDRGFNVSVGCKTFAFESSDQVIKYLTMYLQAPAETIKKYEAGTLFS